MTLEKRLGPKKLKVTPLLLARELEPRPSLRDPKQWFDEDDEDAVDYPNDDE